MRDVPEWIGRTDNVRIPDRVQVRVFERFHGVCQCGCGHLIAARNFDIDHIKPLSMGGEHRESNLQPILPAHHREKTVKEARSRAKADRVAKRHHGLNKGKRPFPTNKDQPYKQKIGGRTEHRVLAGGKSSAQRTAAGQRRLEAGDSWSFPRFSRRFDGIKLISGDGTLTITRMFAPVPVYVDALNDKQHMRFSEQRYLTHTLLSQRKVLAECALGEVSNNPRLFFDIRDGVQPVGSMTADLDLRNQRVDLGMMILPGMTGKGYGSLAWALALEFWLDPQRGGMHKAEAGCMVNNVAMRRVMERCGMVIEGRRSDHFQMEDGPVAAILYGKIS